MNSKLCTILKVNDKKFHTIEFPVHDEKDFTILSTFERCGLLIDWDPRDTNLAGPVELLCTDYDKVYKKFREMEAKFKEAGTDFGDHLFCIDVSQVSAKHLYKLILCSGYSKFILRDNPNLPMLQGSSTDEFEIID